MGGLLIILGFGTWAMVQEGEAHLMLPSLLGFALLINAILLRRTNQYQTALVWLSVLIATVPVAKGGPIFWLLISTEYTPRSPLCIQQCILVILCGTFIFCSLSRLLIHRFGTATHF